MLANTVDLMPEANPASNPVIVNYYVSTLSCLIRLPSTLFMYTLKLIVNLFYFNHDLLISFTRENMEIQIAQYLNLN